MHEVFGARQVRVQRCHHLGAFADRRSDALDRLCAHVADGEDTAAGRFQHTASGAGLRSGNNEAVRVQSDVGTLKPIRIRVGADEQKQMTTPERSPTTPEKIVLRDVASTAIHTYARASAWC